MDRKLFSKGKLVRPKANLPSGSFIALGKEPIPGAKPPLPQLGKREAPVINAIPAKRPKLDVPDSVDAHSVRLTFSFDQRDFISKVNLFLEKGELKSLDQVIISVLKAGFEPRTKGPEPIVAASIALLAKEKPDIFRRPAIVEALCSLLKHPTHLKTGQRPKSITALYVCSLLFSIYAEESEWPAVMAKAYLDDALNERYWVDRTDCGTFVKNVLTGFGTNLESLSSTASLHFDMIVPTTETGGSSPSSSNLGESPMDADAPHDFSNLGESASSSLSNFSLVKPRFNAARVALQTCSVETLREWWNKRMETGAPKSLVMTMVSTCGLPEVRLTAAQRLEVWLQNAKIQRAATQLLFAVAQNTDCRNQTDQEVISLFTKMRLKTKSATNAFLAALNVMFEVNQDNMSATLRLVMHNELSNNRSPHNMAIVSQCFHYNPSLGAWVLGGVFQNLLLGKDDFSRALRVLARELIKGALKYDFPLSDFCQALTQERTDILSVELYQRERLFNATVDLICVSIFSCASPTIRDASSGTKLGPDGKNLTLLRQFYQQVSLVQREAIFWLYAVVPNMIRPQSVEYARGFYRVLFLEKQDYYSGKENWPTEQDRIFLLKLVSDAPVNEDVIFHILLAAMNVDLPLSTTDAIDLIEQIVRRAAVANTDGYETLTINRVEMVEILLLCCRYKVPDTFKSTEVFSTFAVSSQYWKAITTVLILCAHNPTTVGQLVWTNYPSLRCYMKMLMTSDYNFPPESAFSREAAEETLLKDVEARESEKVEILKMENHMAAGAGKPPISEGNSVLLWQLTLLDPKGPARKPSATLVEQLKSLNSTLKLGLMLCKSRNPDFLIEIISGKGSANSLPWLIDMIDSNHGCLAVLPVQCLCEFLLHSMSDSSDSTATPSTPVEITSMKKDKGAKPRENSRLKRTEELKERLRQIIWENGDTEMITQIVGYFLSRLQGDSLDARRLAVEALNILLKTPLTQTPVVKDESMEEETDEQVDFYWLFRYLPRLPCFKDLIRFVCDQLHEALSVETNIVAIMAYLQFLHTYGGTYVEDFVVDLSRVVVERENLLERLLPSDSTWSQAQSDCFVLLLDLFHMYLTKICSTSQGELTWSSSQDHLMVKWGIGEPQRCVTIHVHVVSAMVLLLTFPRPELESKYDELMEFWFPKEKEGRPTAFLADTLEEAELYQDWLKLRMLSSKNSVLVDGVIEAISTEPLAGALMFLMSFGIPMSSVEKLLKLLDRYATKHSSVDPDQLRTVGGYIEAHWQRGATGGRVFMEKFRAQRQDSMEVEIVEPSSGQAIGLLPTFSNFETPEELALNSSVESLMLAVKNAGGEETDPKFVRNWSQLLCSVGGEKNDSILRQMKELEDEGHMPDLPTTSLKRFMKVAVGKEPLLANVVTEMRETPHIVCDESFLQSVSDWLSNVTTATPSNSAANLKKYLAVDPELVNFNQELMVNFIFGQNRFPGSDYLLAMLPHSTRISSFLVVLKNLLNSYNEKTDPSRVLDLTSAFVCHPTLWKGRERKLPRYRHPNLEGQLDGGQILTVVKYILQEANVNGESVIGQRLPLLMSLCSKDSVLEEMTSWLCVESSKPNNKPAVQLLSELYLQRPDIVHRMTNPNLLSLFVPSMNCAKLDELLNRLLREMASLAANDYTSEKMEVINLAFRTLAANYPPVFIRQFPAVTAILRGCLNKSLTRLNRTNWLLFLSSVVEIIELMQPTVFQAEYTQQFTELLDFYFGFIQDHGVRSGRFINIIDKVLGLLHNFHAVQPEATATFLEKHVGLIQHISQRFPHLTKVQSLLARVTLPLPPIIPPPTSDAMIPGGPTIRSELEPLPTRPISPVAEANVIPLVVRLMKAEIDVDLCLVFEDIREFSVRKPGILYHCKARVMSSLTSWNKNCRELAFELLVKRCRDCPLDSQDFFAAYLNALKCKRAEIVMTALKYLPSYIATCRADANVVLKATVANCVQWLSPEASQLLCDGFSSLHHNTSF